MTMANVNDKTKRIRVDTVKVKTVEIDETALRMYALSTIKAGDRVTILIPNGQRINWETKQIEQEWKEATGRAVMPSSLPLSWVLNMGGRFGTPGIATPDNTVAVGKKRI